LIQEPELTELVILLDAEPMVVGMSEDTHDSRSSRTSLTRPPLTRGTLGNGANRLRKSGLGAGSLGFLFDAILFKTRSQSLFNINTIAHAFGFGGFLQPSDNVTRQIDRLGHLRKFSGLIAPF
jgi:hypothetical protein